MSIELIPNQVIEADDAWPFFPYPAAVEKGVLNARPVQQGGRNTPPGVEIANGYIPNVHGGGVFELGDRTVAFDHVVIERMTHDELIIQPSSKHAVSRDGHINNEGVVTMTDSKGVIEVIARVTQNQWVAEHFRRKGLYVSRLGNMAVVNVQQLQLPKYEIAEIDLVAGSLRANAL